MTKAILLLADNDIDFCEGRAEILREEGYRVLVALSPVQARKALEQGGIDLAILDLRLTDDGDAHDSSGLDLAETSAPAIPKIMLTSYPTMEQTKRALSPTHQGQSPAIAFLSKAEGPEALIASIEHSIARWARSEDDIIAQSDRHFEQAQRFFEQQLVPLGLGKKQIVNQSLEELERGLERVNDALKFPGAFGTLKLKVTGTGLLAVSSDTDFHYEIGILPILLERKKTILEQITSLTKESSLRDPEQPNRENVQPLSRVNIGGRRLSAINILFLAANPKDTPQLRLDEEMRALDNALLQAEFRDRFDIKQHWAVRVFDIQGYLLRHKPNIVHFSGHGSPSSEIVLEDNMGNSRPVSPRALSQLFSALKDNIRCVVLNACYSEQQAQAIAEHIECVIGMTRSISDPAAIAFATSFYQALGYGRDVKTAFDLGCIEIDLESLGEQNTPKLLALTSNPKNLVFAPGS